MPMAVGEVLTFKHFQSKDSQQILNVWNYQIGSVTEADVSDYAALARGFYETITPLMVPLQVPALSHTRMLVEELEGLDYGDYFPDSPATGTQNTEAAPIFVAASIQYVRGNKLTRHGWKRIAGLAEFFINVNQLTSGAVSLLQDVIDTCVNPAGVIIPQLDASFEPIGEISLFPVIVGDPVPPSDVYRVQRAVNVVVKPLVTTQNTRKIGRGS